MITTLHKQIFRWKLATLFCFLVMLYSLFFAYLQNQRRECMLDTQIALLTGIQQQDVDKAALCDAVKEQQHIIRQEVTMSTLSWLGVTKESCP